MQGRRGSGAHQPVDVPPAVLLSVSAAHAEGFAASNDNTARLWNAATGEHLPTLEGHTQALIKVAFSPDGALFATASGDKTARLWNPATGEHLRTLSRHTGSVLGVAFSPDGTLLATGGDDTARMWG